MPALPEVSSVAEMYQEEADVFKEDSKAEDAEANVYEEDEEDDVMMIRRPAASFQK